MALASFRVDQVSARDMWCCSYAYTSARVVGVDPHRLNTRQVLGSNLRRHRERLRWTQKDLSNKLKSYGFEWSQPTVAQAELGGRPTSIEELHALAHVLGVAPQVLLYPEGNTEVEIGAVARPAIRPLTRRTVLSAKELADWLWKADGSALSSQEGTPELAAWFEAIGGINELGAAEAARRLDEAGRDQAEKESDGIGQGRRRARREPPRVTAKRRSGSARSRKAEARPQRQEDGEES